MEVRQCQVPSLKQEFVFMMPCGHRTLRSASHPSPHPPPHQSQCLGKTCFATEVPPVSTLSHQPRVRASISARFLLPQWNLHPREARCVADLESSSDMGEEVASVLSLTPRAPLSTCSSNSSCSGSSHSFLNILKDIVFVINPPLFGCCSSSFGLQDLYILSGSGNS